MTFDLVDHRVTKLWVPALSCLVLSLTQPGCVTNDEIVMNTAAPVIPKSDDGPQAIEEAIEAATSHDSEVIDTALPVADPDDRGDEISETFKKGIPLELNEKVEKWIEYFTVRDRERFQRFMERGEKYRPMIQAVLRDQGLPPDLYYQAMIESGFVVHARSVASAVGVWQFIKTTGERYGLVSNYYVDERQDPMRATIAAALYMKDLHNVFQSWYLAMAAYNAGESRIMGAIMRAKTRDFWELVHKKALPRETMNYIPKFLAAAIIGHDPQRYGFDNINGEILPELASATVPAPVKLRDIAKVTGVPYAILKEHNPHLRRNMTPPTKKRNYRLWVPKNLIDRFEGKDQQLASLRVKTTRAVASATGYHRVRRGENLSLIAKKHNMTLAQLKSLNGIRGSRIMVGQRLKIGGSAVSASGRHRVRKGENLSLIAGKYGMTLSQLKRANNIRGSRIYVGQLLKVSGGGAVTKYRVRRGDNLNLIARKFGTSIREIKRLNRLSRNTIYAGQTLKISPNRG